MSREGLKTWLVVGLLCLALAGLRIVFKGWNTEVPNPVTASSGNSSTLETKIYVGVEKTGVFHKHLCSEITEWRLPGVPVLKPDLGPSEMYSTRQAAIDDGYKPCPKCDP